MRALRRLYPDADCALAHSDPLQLLVATILSAQCTDERVNRVTPALFRRYPDAAAYAADLVRLPGVGRKTANVVLGTWFGEPAIFVDTHVARLAGRLGWSRQRDPVKIELDLQKLLPRADWTFTAHALIWHGRRVCKARKPDCAACGLRPDCPHAAN
jgi:endonuclease-3